MGQNLVSTQSQEIRDVAAGEISAGDLVLFTETGNVARASGEIGILNNYDIQGANAILALTAITPQSQSFGNPSGTSFGSSILQMNDGIIVNVYTGDPTLADNWNINIVFRNLLNAANISPILITGENSLTMLRANKLTSNTFVVLWYNSVNFPALKFAIYSSTGSVIKSTTNITSNVPQLYDYNCNIGVLPNGNFVVSYPDGSNNLIFTMYDRLGNVVVNPTTVESGASPLYVHVLPQAITGGFSISWFRSASTANWKFMRYTNAGVASGAIRTMTIPTGSAAGFQGGAIDNNIAIELTNGSIVFQACNSSGFPFLFLYNGAGTTLIRDSINVSSSSAVNGASYIIPALTRMINGGFACVTMGQGATQLITSTFTSLGAFITTRFVASNTSYTSVNTITNAGIKAFNIASRADSPVGFAVLSCHNSNGSLTTNISILSQTGVIRGTIISTVENLVNAQAIVIDDAIMIICYKRSNDNRWVFGTYSCGRRSILGVALNAASTGGQVRIALSGSYPINQNFVTGGLFDTISSAVSGNRGFVSGNGVTLRGIT